MTLWKLAVALSLALAAATGGFIPQENTQGGAADGTQGCECIPVKLCPNGSPFHENSNVTEARKWVENCNNYLEVCCGIQRQENDTFYSASAENHYRECGYKSPKAAEIGEFPWMVSISAAVQEGKDGKEVQNSPEDTYTYQCGGSLIHPQVVLTVAHCVADKKSSQLRVRAGESGTKTKGNQVRPVASIIIHEDFDNKTLHNDIALLFLSEAVLPAENIGFVCLPLKGILPDPGTKCIASARGNDSIVEHPANLKKLKLTVIENEKCQNDLRKTKLGNQFRLHNSFFCADGENGEDVSKDDEGSPLLCPVTDVLVRQIQSGMAASIIESKEIDTPGVFVNLANFREWIDKKILSNNMDTSYYAY